MLEQVSRIFSQSGCDVFDYSQGGVAQTTFELPEVCVGEPHFVSQRLDRQPALYAEFTNVAPEALPQSHWDKRGLFRRSSSHYSDQVAVIWAG